MLYTDKFPRSKMMAFVYNHSSVVIEFQLAQQLRIHVLRPGSYNVCYKIIKFIHYATKK